MSTDHVIQIIERAIKETEFRKMLGSDPTTALSGYELTEEERAIFQDLPTADFDAVMGSLDARISRAMVNLEPGSDAAGELSKLQKKWLPSNFRL